MTADEFKNLRKAYGLTQQECASLLGESVYTIKARESGRAAIPESKANYIRMTLSGERLYIRMTDDGKKIRKWSRTSFSGASEYIFNHKFK